MTPDREQENRDLVLVRRARGGDEKAYELLILIYQDRIASMLRQYFPGDNQTVEDVMQEVFFKAWKALPNFRGNSGFYTWIYSIAANTGRNYFSSMERRRSRETGLEDEQLEQVEDISPQSRPDSDYEAHVRSLSVQRAVQAVPENLREPLRLWSEGFAYKAIAEITGVPLNTVRTRIFRGKKLLEKYLEEWQPDDAGHQQMVEWQ